MSVFVCVCLVVAYSSSLFVFALFWWPSSWWPRRIRKARKP
jgi:hypothetical protein